MSKINDPWVLIQNDEFDSAIEFIDSMFNETQDIFMLNNKNLALFHLKKYGEALNQSQQLISFRNGSTSVDFLNLGIANWILGNNTIAIETWLKAQGCIYKDAAGGMDIQVFLYLAGVKSKQNSLKENAIKAIKKLLKSKRATNWPGPIGHYLLNDITEPELISYVSNIPILKERNLCQADFAIAIKSLERGDEQNYYRKLQDCVNLGSKAYLEQMFYLAKGELEIRN
ncbi:MAG: hypothetical protein ABIN95_08065 [Mucilaginibacter sp.]